MPPLSILKNSQYNISSRENYLEQLIFTNSKLEEIIDSLLEKSPIPPIIILQADHGPGPYWYDSSKDSNMLYGEYSKDEFKERTRILNAYYFPAGGDQVLYDTISPVNTFRVLFNYYFHTDFKVLEDRNYWPVGANLNKCFDITDRVKYD